MIVCGTILQNGSVLLVRHASSHKADYGHWLLPAGRVKEGEGLEEALKREISEETRLHVELSQRLAEHTDPYTGDTLVNFLCTPTTSEIQISSELAEAKWFSLQEIRALDKIHPGLKQFLIGLLEK